MEDIVDVYRTKACVRKPDPEVDKDNATDSSSVSPHATQRILNILTEVFASSAIR